MDWTSYTNRLNIEGNSCRERAINRLKNNITNKASGNPSCKTVLLNGNPYQLVINTGTQPYYKEFETLPGQSINIGDYVEWAKSHWLVVTADSDDEVYVDGKLNQCNWLLKWQNEKGEIIERWAVIVSASKYNDGTSGGNIITLGSDQLAVVIPVDEESLKLKKSKNKKFFIDCYSDEPTAYELTGTGNVVDTYNSHGVTSWIVKETQYSPTADDLKYGVCNYTTPTTPSHPENPDETVVSITSTISGNSSLKVGFSRTYSVIFMDENGAELSDVDFSWNIVSDFNDEITSTVDGKNITLQIDNEDYVDEQIVLQIIVDGTVNSELVIKIKGIF